MNYLNKIELKGKLGKHSQMLMNGDAIMGYMVPVYTERVFRSISGAETVETTWHKVRVITWMPKLRNFEPRPGEPIHIIGNIRYVHHDEIGKHDTIIEATEARYLSEEEAAL